MKTRLSPLLLVGVGLCAGFALCYCLLVVPSRQLDGRSQPPVRPSKAADTATQLRALVLQLRDAYQHHDVAAYERAWADDFTAMDPSGTRRTKAELLRQMQGSRAFMTSGCGTMVTSRS
jgi:hypothetical protein